MGGAPWSLHVGGLLRIRSKTVFISTTLRLTGCSADLDPIVLTSHLCNKLESPTEASRSNASRNCSRYRGEQSPH